MELAKRKAQLKKELEELTKAPPEPEPPKKPTTRGRSPKQKRREDALKRYEKEITRIEGMKATAKVKATLTKAATNELEEELEKIEKMP
jgi:sugar-specific transcriptional regulator TrmB